MAAFLYLWSDLFKKHRDEMGYSNSFLGLGNILLLGHFAKSLIVYSLLQFVTRKRWKNSIQLHPIFQGKVKTLESNETFDLNVKSSFESFEMDSNTTCNEDLDYLENEDFDLNLENQENKFLLESKENQVANMIMHHKRIRRRSLQSSDMKPILLQTNKERRRCKTEPFHDQRQVNQLVDLLERDELQSRSLNIGSKIEMPKGSGKDSAIFIQESPESILFESHESSSAPLIMDNLKEFMMEAERYSKFAIGAYGSHFMKIMGIGRAREFYHTKGDEHHNHQTFAFHTNIPIDNIIISSFHEQASLKELSSTGYEAPVYYVVVDALTSSVVVSIMQAK